VYAAYVGCAAKQWGFGGSEGVIGDERGRSEFERQTALVWAAMKGSEASVRVLLMDKYGVEVDARDCEGRSALSNAAELEGIILVLLASVDVNLKDEEGCSPLLLATKGAHCLVMRLLLEEKEGVDVNLKDDDGRTALLWAAGNGLTPAVELLLAQPGIELNSKDNEGGTPLSWAAKHGKLGAVLRHTHVDVNSRDDKGQTAL
jgi:ankyrin repeat protein